VSLYVFEREMGGTGWRERYRRREKGGEGMNDRERGGYVRERRRNQEGEGM